METLLFIAADSSSATAVVAQFEDAKVNVTVRSVSTEAELASGLDGPSVVLVVAVADDGGLVTPERALARVRAKSLDLPLIVTGQERGRATAEGWLRKGAEDYIPSDELWRVVYATQNALQAGAILQRRQQSELREKQMVRLLAAVQDLSLAADLEAIQVIVRRAARELTGADGATFVLKDGDHCYHADEDAIGPLWKGQRFPLDACVSGWAMSHREPVVINDIFDDARVPVEAYHPTFVRSLLIVPIRPRHPVGAIGNYWAAGHHATATEVEVLQALADATAVAMERVQALAELEQRVKEHTRLLEETNRELQTFSYSVSHDLRSPITAILGFAQILSETVGEGSVEEVRDHCDRIIHHAHRMSGLIRDLLRLAKVAQTALRSERIDLSELAAKTLQQLKEGDPARSVRMTISHDISVQADPQLTAIVLENLLSNAWKYTGKALDAAIEFGSKQDPEEGLVFFVRDNGVGFNPRNAKRLFAPFQRFHEEKEFAGVGVGLATVQRIIHKHGGRIWADAAEGKGATFYFTLPTTPAVEERSRAA